MKIDILTIFPNMFEPVLSESIVKRAQQKKIVKIKTHNLRNFTDDKHRKIDDKPFGGGPGMVMMAQPIYKAIERLIKKKPLKNKSQIKKSGVRTILLTPQGKQLNQASVNNLSKPSILFLFVVITRGLTNALNG